MIKFSMAGTKEECLEAIEIFAQHEYEQMMDGVIPWGRGYENIRAEYND